MGEDKFLGIGLGMVVGAVKSSGLVVLLTFLFLHFGNIYCMQIYFCIARACCSYVCVKYVYSPLKILSSA